MASTSEAERAFLQTFKVALATAIIRTRPAHLSSKQYAQQLANRICSAETSWKTKAENLSEELKETRQEMVLLQLKSEQLGPSDTVVTSLECLVSKGSMGFNDNQSEKPNNDSKSKVDKLNSDNFLSAITRFEHWSETLRNNHCSLEIVKNNIRTSLEDFEKSMKKHAFDSQRFKLSLKSLQTLPTVLKNPAMHSDDQILKTCVKLCELVIANILNNCDGNMKQADVLAEFLVSLSKTCQSIRDTCLARLVTVLCGYSQVLSNTVCVSRLDPQKYEAMFYVCRTLDALNAQTSQRWPVDKDCFENMCIVFVCRGAGLGNHGYKFIMAANRDEVIRRPARQAAFWENNNLLAGCDLTPGYEGGTWLGVTRSGRVGFLTNIRQTPAQISAAGVKKGRGQLVTNFLLDEISTPLQYLQGIGSERTSYSPFNLLVGDINKDLYYLDSQSQNAARKIDTDFYCITNSVMEKPWLKQTNSLEKFKNVVTKTDHGQGLKESLFHMLTDQTKNFPDPYLEDNPMSRWLSSIYCEPCTPLPDYMEGFSTRASTVILVDKNDHVTFEERSKTRLEQLPSEWDKVSFEFQLQT